MASDREEDAVCGSGSDSDREEDAGSGSDSDREEDAGSGSGSKSHRGPTIKAKANKKQLLLIIKEVCQLDREQKNCLLLRHWWQDLWFS